MDSKAKFLREVLGNDGAVALEKAAVRSKELGNILLPRTVVSWLSLATLHAYEDVIPGVENSYLAFRKSEDGFSGNVYIGDTDYRFEDATLYHLAAAIVCALGHDHESINDSVKSTKLADLGKSIDLITKSRVAYKKLMEQKAAKEELSKGKDGEGHGPAAAPLAPTPPAAPTPTASKPTSTPKLPKPSAKPPAAGVKPSIKIGKSQLQSKCSACLQPQFKGEVFKGCYCMASLAKGVKMTKEGEHYKLEFGPSWDNDAIATLLEGLK